MNDDRIEKYRRGVLRRIERQMLCGDLGVVRHPFGMSTQDYQGSMNPGHTQQVHPHSIPLTGFYRSILCLPY